MWVSPLISPGFVARAAMCRALHPGNKGQHYNKLPGRHFEYPSSLADPDHISSGA
jgi:hypothetical protein